MWTIIFNFAVKNIWPCILANLFFAVQSTITSHSMLLIKQLAHATQAMAWVWLGVAIVGALAMKLAGQRGNDLVDAIRNDMMFEGRVIMLSKLDKIKHHPDEKALRNFIEHDSITMLNSQITVIISGVAFAIELLIGCTIFWVYFGFKTMAISFSIAVGIIVVVLLLMLPQKRFSKQYDETMSNFRKALMGFGSLFMEYLYNGTTKYARSRIHEQELEVHTAFTQKRHLKNSFMGTTLALRITGAIIVIFVWKQLVPHEEFDVENAILLGGMFSNILYPFFQLIGIVEQQMELMVTGRRVNEVLKLEEVDDQEKKIDLHEKISVIQFENVKFNVVGKDGQMIPVIDGVDLTIHAGQRIGIAGSSAAGKSSLVKMLYLRNPVSSGRILINGRSIEDYSRESVLRNMYIVAQEAKALEGTVADNLHVSNPRASDDEMKAALTRAGLGYLNLNETVEGDNSRALSGGERQRLSIAKMFLRPEAQIVILDEATSALDELTQYEIIQAVKEWAAEGDRIIISIAHRLSTIQSSDLICYMADGKIIEKGTHDELMQLDGWYARLQNASRNL